MAISCSKENTEIKKSNTTSNFIALYNDSIAKLNKEKVNIDSIAKMNAPAIRELLSGPLFLIHLLPVRSTQMGRVIFILKFGGQHLNNCPIPLLQFR